MGRSPCCEKVGLKKGPWTPEEDHKLLSYIQLYGHGSWRALPSKAGLHRCGKSCRLRWTNYLRPDIKRGNFSIQEEETIIQLHALLGNRWSVIASHLPRRTDNEIKNYWNTQIKKRLIKMGIDPSTHKPKTHITNAGTTISTSAATYNQISHMAQWESARLQAEARLVHKSKLFSFDSNNININNVIKNPNYQSCQAHPGPLINKTVIPPLPPPLYLDVLKTWHARSRFITPAMGRTLESPTSILNFSDNTLPPAINVGFTGNENLENPFEIITNENIINGNSEQAKAPSFLEGFITDLIEIEENKNYWDNILNQVNSSDSQVFY